MSAMSATAPARPRRVFSGIQPSGDLHLGNYLGAIRRLVTDQHHVDGIYSVVNLHAHTLDVEPAAVARQSEDTLALLVACGLDPKTSTVFVQGDVPAHSELTQLLESTASFGELRRMVQFKEKTGGAGADGTGGAPGVEVRLSLLTYPVLMAADILLYDTTEVPVGADQAQHLELTRALAQRFNHRYGRTFVLPVAALPTVAARVMDLQDPTRKMSKSNSDGGGAVAILDAPDTVRRKVRRAVTDTDGEVRHDPAAKPGVSNLLEILAALTAGSPAEVADGIGSYAALKDAVVDAVVEEFRPIRERFLALRADQDGQEFLAAVRAEGAARAAERAAPTLHRVRAAMHLAPPTPSATLAPPSPTPSAALFT